MVGCCGGARNAIEHVKGFVSCWSIEEEGISIGVGYRVLEGYSSKFGRWTAPSFEDCFFKDSDVGCFFNPASANWPPLRRDWCASAGTIWTVRAASRRLCLRRATVVAGVGWPSARAKTLLDWSAVGMKGPRNFPAFEVHAVSHAAEGMDPLRTP